MGLLTYKEMSSNTQEYTESVEIWTILPHSPQKGMLLVALATGCFWFPAAAKLAWMTMEAENSR